MSIIAILDKKILFTISKNSSSIYTYFVSDGTPAGTVELASSSPLARDISISRQIGVGTKDGILYFSDGANLWRTDFTDQGTYSLTKLGTATYSEYLLTEDGFFFVDVSTTKPSIVKIIGEQKTTAFGGTEVIVKKLVGYNKGVLYYTTAEDNTAGSSRIRRSDNTTVGTYNLINNTDGVENGNVTDQTSNFVVLNSIPYIFQSTYLNGTSKKQLAIIETVGGKEVRRVVQDNIGVRFTDFFVLNNKAVGKLENGSYGDISALDPLATVSSCLLSGSVAAGSTTLPCGGSLSLTAVALGGTAPFTYQWLKGSVNPIAGATSSTLAIREAGDYFYVEITDAKGCKVKVGSLFINAPPQNCIPSSCSLTASIFGNATLPCTANANTPLTASATGGTAPLTYQWQRNNTNITGATSATYAANAVGDYTVLVTDSKSCSAISAKLTLTGAKPVAASIIGSTTLCTGQPATLNASLSSGTAPYTYQWKQNGNVVGTNAASLSITTGGTYSLSVTDACSSTTASFMVTESPSPAVSISGGPAVCTGQSTTLTATATGGTGAYTYQWKQGSTTVGTNAPSLTATGGNTYGLTVTDAKGCAVTAAVSVSSGACATPAVSLPPGGATATAPITLTATTGLTGGADAGATYQWLLNGNPIAGATNPTYTASASGSYAVIITLSGRATTSPAVVLTINIILATEPTGLAENQVVLYPNPTTGECQVTVEVATRQTINLQLLDALGKSVRQWRVPVAPKMSPVRVVLPDADGLYFLRVETETGVVVKKVLRVN